MRARDQLHLCVADSEAADGITVQVGQVLDNLVSFEVVDLDRAILVAYEYQLSRWVGDDGVDRASEGIALCQLSDEGHLLLEPFEEDDI